MKKIIDFFSNNILEVAVSIIILIGGIILYKEITVTDDEAICQMHVIETMYRDSIITESMRDSYIQDIKKFGPYDMYEFHDVVKSLSME